jgi:LAO/AO transport system kinase
MPLSKQVSLLKQLDELHAHMAAPCNEELKTLLLQAKALEKWPIAQLISIFERNTTENLIKRHQIIKELESNPDTYNKQAKVLGFTGTPGAGKSSLIGVTCLELLKQNPDLSIAVIAIDPSSQSSGGALLGDRTRTQFPVNDARIFFRSQASHLDLGGMGKTTFNAVRALRRLFDLIVIETVGIGQSEIEVQRLADHTLLVMQPLAGDQVQFMKAGIMEVPDSFIINKCDEDELAKKSHHLLKASLKLAQVLPKEGEQEAEIFMTSATRHKGIEELAGKLLREVRAGESKDLMEQENYFLNKWVQEAYGEFGIGLLEHFKGESSLEHGTFEEKELAYKSLIAKFLSRLN